MILSRQLQLGLMAVLLTGCASFAGSDHDDSGAIAVDSRGLPMNQRSVASPSNGSELIKQIRASDTQQLGVQVNRVRDGSLRVILPGGAAFKKSGTRFSSKMKPVLNTIAQAFEKSPYLRVKVVGHSDSQGDPVVNQTLSIKRATAVANYLIQRGIKSVMIEIEGRGSIDPLMSNDTAHGRTANRRIELYLYEIR